MMKKIFFALVALIGLICNQAQAQTVGCDDTVHWGTPLSFEANKCCWTVLEGPTDCFYDGTNQIDCNYDTLADHRFLSPWVEIPSFAATDSLVLIYATLTSCTADYSVTITTDGVNYDTLRRRLVDDYEHDTILLGAYAGQVVRIEFCHYGLNSRFYPYAGNCSYAADYNWQLLFEALQWRSLVYPVATWWVPTKAYVGETTWLRATLTHGSHTGLTYTWHSSLTGQTLTGDSVGLAYTAAGLDTLTLVVSNAFGSDTLTQTVTVVDCGDVITAHPCKVDFANEYDCWRMVGTVGWSYAGRNISGNVYYGISALHNSGGANIITSPAVVLPTDSTGLRLYWKDCRLSSGTATYYVLVSTTSRYDITAYDTVFTCTSQTNNLTQRSVSLANYADDTVYIAFCKMLQNGRTVFITDVQMYNALAPIGVIHTPNYVLVGEAVNYTLTLSQGDTLGLTVTLHSALKDSTWAMNADGLGNGSWGLDLVYDTPGEETVTVTASNAQGTMMLNASLGVFVCNTVSTFPWEEDFSNPAGSYNACWTINGYSHNNSSYNSYDEETNEYWAITNYMRPSAAGNYMITPSIAIPANETNMTFMVEYVRGALDIRVSPTASTDTALFTDLLFTEPSSNYIKRRWINLSAYAGQTIRVALVTTNPNSQCVNRVWVGDDTLPYIGTKVSMPTQIHGDSTALCTVALCHGATDGLHYTWTSAVGGIFTTNALGDSTWVTYSAGFSSTEDTITVIATNAYGADTVTKPLHIIDCSPVSTLPWTETFDDGSMCWYVPAGSNWNDAKPNAYSTIHALLSNYTNDTLNHWVISPAIQMPADTNDIIMLEWDEAAKMGDATHQPHYSVLVSTDTNFLNLTTYDTLLTVSSGVVNSGSYWSSWGARNVSLTGYAGQSIHVAFCRHPSYYGNTSERLLIDNITVRSASAPVVTLTAPTLVESYDTVTFTANLTEGLPCTYTLHSTLLDTTLTDTAHLSAFTFHLFYTVGGTDTVKVVATNAYGSDSATAVVQVLDCPPIALPWTEGFDALVGTAYNVEGSLPDCWRSYWNGSNAAYAPHVINGYPLNPLSGYFTNGQKALVLVAGAAGGLDSVAIVEGPKVVGDLNGSRLSFFYKHERGDIGQLSVGYMQDGTFVGLIDLPRQQTGEVVSLQLDSIPAGVNRIALKWKQFISLYSIIVDNIELTVFDSVPTVAIVPPQYVGGDSFLFRAYLTNGSSDSITYSWQSSMDDAGQATLTAVNDSAYIEYTAAGSDTVSVIATNTYGSDTAWMVYTYMGAPRATISGPSSTLTDDTVTYRAYLNSGSTRGLGFSWQSSMAAAGQAAMTDTGNTIQIVYFAGGTDTLTLITTNAFGVDTTRRFVTVTGCHITTFPWTEGFENGVNSCWHLSTIPGSTTTNWRINGEYWYAHSGSHYLYSPVATADGDSGSIDAWFILPPVDVPAGSNLSLSFYANFFGNSLTGTYPRLTVLVSTMGNALAHFTDTIYSEQNNTLDHEYLFRSASLAAYAGQTVRIAFVHENRYVSLAIDDLSIDYSAVPVAAISGPSEQFSSEEAIFTAHLLNGDTTGITYTWHSTMADAGLATLTATDSTAAIEYHAGGTDHVSVVIANAASRDSVAMTCSVTDCEPITQLPYSVRLNNNIACWLRESGWHVGDYFSSHITCMQYKNWDSDPVDRWLIMREIAIPADYTHSYTLRWHMQCDHSKYQVMVSTQGRSSHSLFDTLYYEQNDSTHWTSRTLSLDAYRGQNIYIAFRNLGWYNSPTHYAGMGVIRIDTVQVLVSNATVIPQPDTIWRNVSVYMVNSISNDTPTESDGVSVTGTGVYADSTLVTLTAIYNNDLWFWYWVNSVGDTIRDNPYSFIITSDTVFTAIFGPRCVGIGNVNGLPNVAIHPNPTTGDAYISVGVPSVVTVTDLQGRTVIQPTQVDSTLRIAQGTLPKGIYFVSVGNSAGTTVKKLVIQ